MASIDHELVRSARLSMEAMLRNVWQAGFDAGMQTAHEGTHDIPDLYKFEQFMELLAIEISGEKS